MGQAALLADTGFVLPPQFDRLVTGLMRDRLAEQCGKVYGMARPLYPDSVG